MKTLPLLFVTLSFSAGAALAQTAAAPAPAAEDDRDGTTVMGDRESPIGLLIAPWREATPEKNLDRPVRFLQEELMPLDPEVFRRQVEYHYTIAAHLRSRGVAGYAEPAPVPAAGAAATPPATVPTPPAQ